MDNKKLADLLEKIVDVKLDSIHHYNSNGADWHSCRLCYASRDEIRGVYQPIIHYDDCPGTIAQQLLDEIQQEGK